MFFFDGNNLFLCSSCLHFNRKKTFKSDLVQKVDNCILKKSF